MLQVWYADHDRDMPRRWQSLLVAPEDAHQEVPAEKGKEGGAGRMRRFELIETTGDIGFMAYGTTMSRAFENAGLALFEIMTDAKKVAPSETRYVEIEAEDIGALLFDWITKLLYLNGAEGMLFSKFRASVTPVEGGFRLEATVGGKPFDGGRHDSRVEVKAMTYHLMEIHDEAGNCFVQAVVDI